MVWSEGNMSLKKPVTPPGIDPETVRLVAQRLNQYATSDPTFSYTQGYSLWNGIVFDWRDLFSFGDQRASLPTECSPCEENDNYFHLRINFLHSGTKACPCPKYCYCIVTDKLTERFQLIKWSNKTQSNQTFIKLLNLQILATRFGS